MSRRYLQRFEDRGAISRAEFENTLGGALEAFAQVGDRGGVPAGVTHVRTSGTGRGKYALVEVDDPEAFARYQARHDQRYGRIATVTWGPPFGMDAAVAPAIRDLKAKTR